MSEEIITTGEEAQKDVDPKVEPQVAPEINKEQVYNEILQKRIGLPEEDVVSRLKKAEEWGWVEEDSYAKKVLEAVREGKDLRQIAEKIGTNWEEASDDEVILHHLKSQYPEAKQPGVLGDLMREEFAALFDEDATDTAKLKAKAQVRKIRDLLKEEASSFGKPVNRFEQEQQAAVEELKRYQEAVSSAPELQQFEKSAEIVFSDSGVEHRYKIGDAKKVVDTIKNPAEIWTLIGGLKLDQQIEAIAYLSDPKSYKTQLIELGKTASKLSKEGEVRSADAENVQPQTPPENISLPDNPENWGPEDLKKFFSSAKRVS